MTKIEGNLHSQLKKTQGLSPTLSLSALTPYTTQGLLNAKAYWIEKVLKDKFALYARSKYKFFRRSRAYQVRKERFDELMDNRLKIRRPLVKPPQDLVLFGDLKQELMSRPHDGFNTEIKATDKKTEMRIRVRSPHPMRRNQWLELKDTLPSQTRNMVELVKKEFTRGLQELMAA
jgi:hypothetical protein